MNDEKPNQQEVVEESLRALRESLRAKRAPGRVEHRLVAAFRERQRNQRQSRRWHWLAAAAAVALILVAVLVLRPDAEAPGQLSPLVAQEVATDYIPVVFGPPLEADEFSQVIRISVPRSEMARYGLPVDGGPAARVKADVVLGEDGIARAIRFVQ